MAARARRRGRLLAAATGAGAVVAFALGLIVGGDDGGDGASGTSAATEPAAAAPALSLPELVGQRLVAGFDGSDPPRGLLRMLAAGELAGVILFEENVAGGRRATARMTSGLQEAAARGPVEAPLAVMTDQEGGLVKRVPGPPAASAAAMARRGAAFARRQGAATARSLLRHGVNVDLAPVLDLA
ncbi:MAG TPA: glycoside hydrolase family 3 N-terminal domain-containing protein, partial [Solirubrobacterales bacterium]|nr:glycoside hydrolase family 3 N-terminal domain-containing protein [Solirubrobacterales bacterium]